MSRDPAAADGALDVLWAEFFRWRAAHVTGSADPAAALDVLRDLHRRAGATGSAHVPVFRAEVRGEISLIKAALSRTVDRGGDPRPPGPGGPDR